MSLALPSPSQESKLVYDKKKEDTKMRERVGKKESHVCKQHAGGSQEYYKYEQASGDDLISSRSHWTSLNDECAGGTTYEEIDVSSDLVISAATSPSIDGFISQSLYINASLSRLRWTESMRSAHIVKLCSLRLI